MLVYLRSCCALDASESEVVSCPLHRSQVHHQVLNPHACSLAHSRQLCLIGLVAYTRPRRIAYSLQMSVAQTRLVFPFDCKSRQFADDIRTSLDNHVQSVAHHDELGIVGDIAARGSPVDLACGCRSSQTIRVHPCHDIVTARVSQSSVEPHRDQHTGRALPPWQQ